jgi:hypothetical protein
LPDHAINLPGADTNVQSQPPGSIAYTGDAEQMQEVWIAVRANLRAVLEDVTPADLVSGDLPAKVSNWRRPRRLGRP